MRETGNTRQISQGAVRYHSDGLAPLRHVRSNGARRAKDAHAARDAFGFLNTKIEELGMNDDTLSGYGISVAGSYETLLDGSSRFLSHFGRQVLEQATQGATYCEKLSSLTSYIEEEVKRLGFDFTTTKEDNGDGLDFVVYIWGRELEDTVVMFYVAPALYLSEKTSHWFKQFMKFTSDSMAVTMGENSDNYHLDYTLEMALEEAEADPDEEMYIGAASNAAIAREYKKGRFKKMFKEIDAMPKMTQEQLINGMTEYRSQCPNDEVDLVDLMIEGVPLVARANIYKFDFNPDSTGLPDDESNETWLSSPLATCILFSRNDGVGEAMIDNINTDVGSGTLGYSWNRAICLDARLSEEKIADFEADQYFLPAFNDWLGRFNEETEKFDKYDKYADRNLEK